MRSDETGKRGNVRKAKLYETIVTSIQQLIASERLKHGDQLPPERDLAAMFKVSRHSLREAIRILEEKKILRSRTGSGTYVILDDESSVVELLARAIHEEKYRISEIFQFRRMLEPQIAALAAENAGAEDLQELERILDIHERNETDVSDWIELDEAFHLAIARATRNSIVLSIVERINDIMAKSRGEISQSSARRQKSLKGHRNILEAIRKGDGDQAAKAMTEHLSIIEDLVVHQTE